MIRRQGGFTLIEILVVLMMVAVMVSVGVISVRGRDLQAVVDDTVRQLAYSLELAEEETLFRRRTLGLYLDTGGYSFLVRDEEGWYPVDDRFFKPRAFPEDIFVTLYVDGSPQALNDVKDDGVDDEETTIPQVSFIPDAEPVPFEILFQSEGLQERKMTRTPTGRIVTSMDRDQQQ